MKIEINNIGKFELLDKKYYSNDIFRFRIDGKRMFDAKMIKFEQGVNDPTNRISILIKENILKNHLENYGSPIELMTLNLTHLLLADFYYSNGQIVISIVKTQNGWQIGKLGTLFDFSDALSEYEPLTKFTLKSLNLVSYRIFEKAELLAFEELRLTEIIKLPLLSKGELKLQFFYPNNYFVFFDNGDKKQYLNLEADELTNVLQSELVLDKIMTCLNCEHFQYSGMSYDMSGGETGYCFYLRNLIEDKSVSETITHIWNWCNKFKIKEITNG